ncbi:DUF4265 domain-containing protein [Corallococcus silvisoli]|uniref:DUF4265 domain-containing protein n=1 Tax=Corallococcus silvisoli TaxID=2697031 RepID=UPI00137699F1|nr:DUF4265 domain-containing protein [Corallococcus silvisoli]
MSGRRKVFFRLEQDEDGYPPVGTESLWCTPVGGGLFVLDNIPFFFRGATLGDSIEVEEEDGRLWYRATRRESGNSLLRLIVYDRMSLVGVVGELKRLGCSTEFDAAHGVVAVNVPGGVSLGEVRRYVAGAMTAGLVDCEEPILRQEWARSPGEGKS